MRQGEGGPPSDSASGVRQSGDAAPTEGELDDDEEQLVQEVLADFPPEERGERDEWSEHVGWHRREDINNNEAGGDRDRQEIVDATGKAEGGQLHTSEETLPVIGRSKLLRGANVAAEGSRIKEESSAVLYGAMILSIISCAIVIVCTARRDKKQRTL